MVSNAYNLRIYPPLTRPAAGHVEDFTQYAQQYKQSTRAKGGFWQASWLFTTDGGGDRRMAVEREYLTRWYDEMIMYRFRNVVGGLVAWDGFAAEMELTINGLTERRSIFDMVNAVKVSYTDETGADQETAWQVAADSVSRFGRREEIVTLSEVTTEEAEAYRARYLREHAWPYSRPTKIDLNAGDGVDSLTVTAVGRVGTANFKYLTAGDGVTTDNADDFIRDIISTDIEFLQAGSIQVNDTQILQRPKGEPQRAYDRILEIAEMGRVSGGDHELWRFWVGADGYANYEPFSNEPLYEWLRNGRLVGVDVGEVDAWTMRPGVVRNRSRRGGLAAPGSLLQRANDVYVAEIEVAAGADNPTLKPEVESESSIYQAIDQYQQWLEGLDDA